MHLAGSVSINNSNSNYCLIVHLGSWRKSATPFSTAEMRLNLRTTNLLADEIEIILRAFRTRSPERQRQRHEKPLDNDGKSGSKSVD